MNTNNDSFRISEGPSLLNEMDQYLFHNKKAQVDLVGNQNISQDAQDLLRNRAVLIKEVTSLRRHLNTHLNNIEEGFVLRISEQYHSIVASTRNLVDRFALLERVSNSFSSLKEDLSAVGLSGNDEERTRQLKVIEVILESLRESADASFSFIKQARECYQAALNFNFDPSPIPRHVAPDTTAEIDIDASGEDKRVFSKVKLA